MALSFIGKPISLISHSDVRYRGILAGIDPQASTIQLSNVYSMGTESRRSPEEYIPPVPEPYQYIIFKAGEVKDLAVDEPVVQRRNVHDDPAVMASAPLAANSYAPYAPPAPAANSPSAQQPVQSQAPQGYTPRPSQMPQAQLQGEQQPVPSQQQKKQPSAPLTAAQAVVGTNGQVTPTAAPRVPQRQQSRPNAVQTAAASLETVERALGDLRVSNGTTVTAAAIATTTHHRGGRRGGHGYGGRAGRAGDGATNAIVEVPTDDFDFELMNAKFDKAALMPKDPNAGPLSAAANGNTASPSASPTEEGGNGKEKAAAAYNPTKSFFDTLSSNTAPEPNARGAVGGAGHRSGGRGRGGAGGRNRREEEREKNVATFGEPGGVGLMGPGAYVGGWGGYGRRGGRGRGRGGPRGGYAPREQQRNAPAPDQG